MGTRGSEAYRASRVVFVQDVSFEFFTGTGDHLEFIAQRPERLARGAVKNPWYWPELLLRDVHQVHGTVGVPYHVFWPEDPLRDRLEVYRPVGVAWHVGWLQWQLHGDDVAARVGGQPFRCRRTGVMMHVLSVTPPSLFCRGRARGARPSPGPTTQAARSAWMCLRLSD